MSYSVMDSTFALPGPTRKLYYVDPDVNGLGLDCLYFGGDRHLTAGPGYFSTASYEEQRYLDSCDVPRVHFIGTLPL